MTVVRLFQGFTGNMGYISGASPAGRQLRLQSGSGAATMIW